MWRLLSRPGVGLVAVVAVALGAMVVLPSYATFQLTYVAIFAIAILGLNLLTGFNGQVSLGHGAFMAVGAYTTGILAGHLGWPLLLTIPLAGLVSGGLGLALGVPAVRLSGLYLALATFALAVSVPTIVRKFGDITGGSRGILLPSILLPRSVDPSSIGLDSTDILYLLVLAIAVFLFWFASNLVRSGTGRALMAIREGELAAASFGVNLTAYKALAFGLSAFYAGVAGSLLAIATTFIAPDGFAATLSISLLVGAVVGGLGSLWGPALGGFLVVFLPIYAQQISQAAPSVAYGVILILVVFLMPRGVSGLIGSGFGRLRWLTRGRAPRQP
jgi:branched-chain amino acid transport system permease protein